MTVDEAYKVVCDNLRYQVGAFYGSAKHLVLGAGMLYTNVRQPAFDELTMLYKTVRSLVYVITHECDVAQSNLRPLNDSVVICPLIPFENFVERFKALPNLPAFLGELATRDVYRAVYIPSHEQIPYGAILYLNRLTSAHITAFSENGVECFGAVSTLGLIEIDAALKNNFFREKAEQLSDWPNVAPGRELNG